MLRNYLLIAFRNLWHNKVYALINILGLAIGLTAALFIFQYVQFERSYDSFHEKADHIYRIIFLAIHRDGTEEAPQHMMSSALGPEVKKVYPEVLNYARIYKHDTENFIISFNQEDGTPPKEFLEEKVFYADASFMQMFSFPMIVGDAVKGLQETNTLLLSESMAEKFFGKNWQASDPTGKILTINGEQPFMVKGVFKDIPENSHIKFEVLLSLTTLAEKYNYDTKWATWKFPTYLEVEPETDIQQLEDRITATIQKGWEDAIKELGGKVLLQLQPVTSAHLHSFGYKNEPVGRGNITIVQFLFITACFILILAWINYVNLSTARAVKRAKEVGIRKVVGAGRRQLITQFLLEAFLINLLSIVVALTLYQLCFSFFTHLVQKQIPINSLIATPWFLTGIILVLILGTLLSGGYSAFVLSSFKAVSIMKGKFHTSARGVLLRKSLIVFQFVISVSLIIGTLCVYQQLLFMKNHKMGYDMSQKLVVRAPKVTDENYAHHYESFKTALQKLPDIGRVTASYLSPGDAQGKGPQWVHKKKQPDKKVLTTLNSVDYDYLETYEIQLLHGRGFSQDFPADKDAVVITEDVALQLGFDPVETALQEKIVCVLTSVQEFSIIGIVKNINLWSLKYQQTGTMFYLGKDSQEFLKHARPFSYFTIDLDNLSHLQNNIANIEGLYKSLFPGNPFTYFFLDEYFNAQYQAEEQYGKVFTTASGLAIFIACLGLFGLSAFMIRQRTKEIGIRKVLGAPVQTILLLLSRDYIRLIAIAGLIALPLAYWGLHRWLESYLVRISLSWWFFLIPVALVIFIALVTVGYQTIKAALANPARSLRYE